MKELTLETMLAVFQEIFGTGVFWTLVAAAAAVTAAYLFVLVRDRSVSWKKFLLAQLSMPLGAVAAVVIVLQVTQSQLTDIASPVDFIVFAAVAALGAVGMAILVYTVEALIGSRRTMPR